MVTRHVPMKRELKGVEPRTGVNVPVVTRHVPMKRELKVLLIVIPGL